MFVRLLWSLGTDLVGVTNDGVIVRFDSGLGVVPTTGWGMERQVTAIRDLRTASLVDSTLILVGADRLGRGAAVVYDLDDDTWTADRELSREVILAASTMSVGTELPDGGVGFMPWHVPVPCLAYQPLDDVGVEVAAGYDEVWIAFNTGDPQLLTYHILNELDQHITNEAGERIMYDPSP